MRLLAHKIGSLAGRGIRHMTATPAQRTAAMLGIGTGLLAGSVLRPKAAAVAGLTAVTGGVGSGQNSFAAKENTANFISATGIGYLAGGAIGGALNSGVLESEEERQNVTKGQRAFRVLGGALAGSATGGLIGGAVQLRNIVNKATQGADPNFWASPNSPNNREAFRKRAKEMGYDPDYVERSAREYQQYAQQKRAERTAAPFTKTQQAKVSLDGINIGSVTTPEQAKKAAQDINVAWDSINAQKQTGQIDEATYKRYKQRRTQLMRDLSNKFNNSYSRSPKGTVSFMSM